MVDFNYDDKGKKLVCTLKGRFGSDVTEPFSAELTRNMEKHTKTIKDPEKLNVCFDMKQVSFIASAFIRTCLSTSRSVDPGNFKIINASPMIKKTFKIAGLDEMLNVS
jgi:anti-anti-sigma factor